MTLLAERAACVAIVINGCMRRLYRLLRNWQARGVTPVNLGGRISPMQNIRIVLTQPSHPGNIGACARAMKNMAISQLVLVDPKEFPHCEATIRAAGADDILANASVVDSLEAALVGCQKVFATSARTRRLEWPLCTPREAAAQIYELQGAQTAIVFGRENSGLTNAELALCHHHIHIPTVESFSSLNLAAAVQVLCYEIYAFDKSVTINEADLSDQATADELDGFFEHLALAMEAVGFLNRKHPKKLMFRLRRLFQRAEMSKTEINILRGFLTAVEKSTD